MSLREMNSRTCFIYLCASNMVFKRWIYKIRLHKRNTTLDFSSVFLFCSSVMIYYEDRPNGQYILYHIHTKGLRSFSHDEPMVQNDGTLIHCHFHLGSVYPLKRLRKRIFFDNSKLILPSLLMYVFNIK